MMRKRILFPVPGRNTELRSFRSRVTSELLYGSETWLVSADINRCVQVFVNYCNYYCCYTGYVKNIIKELRHNTFKKLYLMQNRNIKDCCRYNDQQYIYYIKLSVHFKEDKHFSSLNGMETKGYHI